MVSIKDFLIFVVFLLFSAGVLAGTIEGIFPFADTKVIEKSVIGDMSEFIKEDFNPDYGIIRLSNEGWLSDKKIAEYSLTKVSEYCSTECNATGKLTLYEDGYLFEDMKFKDYANRDVSLDYQYYLLGSELYDLEVPIYNLTCSNVSYYSNLTYFNKTVCINDEVGKTIYYNQTRDVWNLYDGKVLKAGNYEWKLQINGSFYTSIDFIPIKAGNELNEWAWWVGVNKTEFYNASDDDEAGGWTYTEYQTFTIGTVGPNDNQTLYSVKLYLNEWGGTNTGKVYAYLRNVDGTGKPIGANLTFGNISYSSISSGLSWVEIVMNYTTQVRLNASTKYALLFQTKGEDGVNWRRNSAGGHTGGNGGYSADEITWTAETTDLMFEIWSSNPNPADTTKPIVNITYYVHNWTALPLGWVSSNISALNYTATDETGIGKCWWSSNGGVTNSSVVNCGTNWTGLNSVEGNQTWTVYANDTSGNIGNYSVKFAKDSVCPNITWVTVPINGSIQTSRDIILNVTGSDLHLLSVVLTISNLTTTLNTTTHLYPSGFNDSIYINYTVPRDGNYSFIGQVDDLAQTCTIKTDGGISRYLTVDSSYSVANVTIAGGIAYAPEIPFLNSKKLTYTWVIFIFLGLLVLVALTDKSFLRGR